MVHCCRLLSGPPFGDSKGAVGGSSDFGGGCWYQGRNAKSHAGCYQKVIGSASGLPWCPWRLCTCCRVILKGRHVAQLLAMCCL